MKVIEKFTASLVLVAVTLLNVKVTAAVATRHSTSPISSSTLILPLAPKIPREPATVASKSSSTLLLPLTPKIDDSRRESSPKQTYSLRSAPENVSTETSAVTETNTEELGDDSQIDIGKDTLLKGTVQIVADDTEYDQDKNTFLGTGNAVAIIAGQNSRLEADTILYDQNTQTIDARGNVKILRQGQLTTGSAFRFKVSSDEYLVTEPDTELQGTTIIARQGHGNSKNLFFKDGTMQLPQPIHIASNALWGPLSAAEESAEKGAHPDAYLPSKPSFKFKARKMTYEQYKESGNLTVFGGKLMFGKFAVPLPKFTATVGQENSRVVFPVTPIISNNLQVGGINIGPSFNYTMGKTGVFHWAPLLQIGGRSIDRQSNSGRYGAGAQIGFSNDRLSSHLAYGSVSNLLVADFRYQISKKLKFQAGINRFLEDGLFGMRRPRLISEVIHNHVISGIPYIAMLGFRTSAGWAQDQPRLVNLTPKFGQLFSNTNKKGTVSAFRIQEQITAYTHPVISVGDNNFGAQLNFFGGLAIKGYSGGDSMVMGQVGPILNAHLGRVRLQGGYAQSAVRGKSPFVFDQFIQGNRSCYIGGDVKVSKWLTLGANLGYNLNNRLLYQRSLTAAIGPEDFKILITRDTIRGMNRLGFDVLYGMPIPYNKLVLKGNPDAGQVGGI